MCIFFSSLTELREDNNVNVQKTFLTSTMRADRHFWLVCRGEGGVSFLIHLFYDYAIKLMTPMFLVLVGKGRGRSICMNHIIFNEHDIFFIKVGHENYTNSYQLRSHYQLTMAFLLTWRKWVAKHKSHVYNICSHYICWILLIVNFYCLFPSSFWNIFDQYVLTLRNCMYVFLTAFQKAICKVLTKVS